jgi:hypothetical protein
LEHKYKNIFADELSNHLKFTIWAVIIAAGLIVFAKRFVFGTMIPVGSNEELFEGFFVSHLFFASLTPAALFRMYRKSVWIGIITAIITSSVTCTLSDIIFPYAGGLLLNYNMHFHVCIIEEPLLAWSFVIGGAIIGFFLSGSVRKLSRYTHGAHILLSSLAAGMYLITYGVGIFTTKTLIFIPILIVSVLIPCVMNDIGVPSWIVALTAKPGENKKELRDMVHSAHHDHHH